MAWTRARLVSAWNCAQPCNSFHREARIEGADRKLSGRLTGHPATHWAELVDAEPGEVFRRYVCTNAAAQFAWEYKLVFPTGKQD